MRGRVAKHERRQKSHKASTFFEIGVKVLSRRFVAFAGLQHG